MLVVEEEVLGHGMTKEIEPSMMFEKLLNTLYGEPVMIINLGSTNMYEFHQALCISHE